MSQLILVSASVMRLSKPDLCLLEYFVYQRVFEVDCRSVTEMTEEYVYLRHIFFIPSILRVSLNYIFVPMLVNDRL